MHIELYKSGSKKVSIKVAFDEDTVWLSQKQMTELFRRDRSVITKHIQNVFNEKELTRKSNVQKMHIAGSDKPTAFYSLDVIISVGYRVKSKQGTLFRQWATQRLKDYIIQGYAINEKRLKQLEQVVEIVKKTGTTKGLSSGEAKGLLEIITDYTKSFILLNQYDSRNLPDEKLSEKITYEIEFEEALDAIEQLKKKLMNKKQATALFGNRKDESFKGILGAVVQSFDGQYLYNSIEEQAAHLLYFVIKNHPFSDGNKRIGAFLFVWFLEKNKHRISKSGHVKINDTGLAALALLIAQSDPSDKDLMIKLVINMINNR